MSCEFERLRQTRDEVLHRDDELRLLQDDGGRIRINTSTISIRAIEWHAVAEVRPRADDVRPTDTA